jgi:hypothetical protein
MSKSICLLGGPMKLFQYLLVSLVLLLAGGWANLEAIEPSERFAQSTDVDETVSPAEQIPRIQERLLNDEAVLKKIQALQNDPDIRAVLNDSALMEALRAGDLNAVTSNPKFMRLLENPAIQEILEEAR